MNDDIALIVDTVLRWAKKLPATVSGNLDTASWREAQELGLMGLMVQEAHGGLGLNWQQAGPVLQALGEAAVALPIAETLIAAFLYSKYGQIPPDGVLSLAVRTHGQCDGHHFSGTVAGVPFGRHADFILAQRGNTLFALKRSDADVAQLRLNPANEACDAFQFTNTPVNCLGTARGDELLLIGALTRSCQSAGALKAALSLTIGYAGERVQFGRTLSKFQAVQQLLAQFGAEVAAVTCAVGAACRAMDTNASAFAIGSAKLRSHMAIGLGTATAHQVHGAIGFTREYHLRQWTQRLWHWRSEFGNDLFWSEWLGAMIADQGANQFWNYLTSIDDPNPVIDIATT